MANLGVGSSLKIGAVKTFLPNMVLYYPTSKSFTFIMKKYYFLPILALLFTLSGCSAIEGIFKAGVWVGIIVVVVVILVIIWIISAFRK